MLFLATATSFAQNEPAVLTFKYCRVTENGITESDWKEVPSTVTIYNSTVKMTVGNREFNLIQDSEVQEGVTRGGFKYDACLLREIKTQEQILLQVFRDENYGMRLIFSKENYIDFNN